MIIDWIRRRLVGPTLLQDIPLLPLGSSYSDAVAAYGQPTESKPNANFPEAREIAFEISEYHRIVLWEWNSCVHAITYFSAAGEPVLDLETMVETYGDKQEWDTINEGYLYRRRDKKIRLWCSVMPALGVGTEEYFDAERRYRESHAQPDQPSPTSPLTH